MNMRQLLKLGFQKRLAKGKENYGRQDISVVKPKLHPAITARVYRAATDKWEKLEVFVKQGGS